MLQDPADWRTLDRTYRTMIYRTKGYERYNSLRADRPAAGHEDGSFCGHDFALLLLHAGDRYGLGPVGRFADHGDALQRAEHLAQPVADRRGIINDEDAGSAVRLHAHILCAASDRAH